MCIEKEDIMSNPVLNNRFLENERVLEAAPMSVVGAINKALILFSLLFLSAAFAWGMFMAGFVDRAKMLTTGGAVVGFVLAMIIIFGRNKESYKYLTPIYAIAEGCFVGGISAFFESFIAGIVSQAVVATFATILSMLALYRAGLIRSTEKFRSVVLISTLSIGAIYLIQWIASFFGRSIPELFTASSVGIGFSIFVVVIVALNLVIDFDFIERGVDNMLDKEFEWYGAFGLMVTIVWLYIELLNLLAKLNSRN